MLADIKLFKIILLPTTNFAVLLKPRGFCLASGDRRSQKMTSSKNLKNRKFYCNVAKIR